jgi:hypothetical protein
VLAEVRRHNPQVHQADDQVGIEVPAVADHDAGVRGSCRCFSRSSDGVGAAS